MEPLFTHQNPPTHSHIHTLQKGLGQQTLVQIINQIEPHQIIELTDSNDLESSSVSSPSSVLSDLDITCDSQIVLLPGFSPSAPVPTPAASTSAAKGSSKSAVKSSSLKSAANPNASDLNRGVEQKSTTELPVTRSPSCDL